LKRHSNETLIHKDCNIIKKQLNSIAETVDCKQFISHAIVKVLIIHKTIYDSSSKFVIKFIKILQQEDKFTVRLKADEIMNIQKNDIKS